MCQIFSLAFPSLSTTELTHPPYLRFDFFCRIFFLFFRFRHQRPRCQGVCRPVAPYRQQRRLHRLRRKKQERARAPRRRLFFVSCRKIVLDTLSLSPGDKRDGVVSQTLEKSAQLFRPAAILAQARADRALLFVSRGCFCLLHSRLPSVSGERGRSCARFSAGLRSWTHGCFSLFAFPHERGALVLSG